MRLSITALAMAVALTLSAVAFAAETQVNRSMGGTANIGSGGKLRLVVTHKSGARRFHVRINYDTQVRSRTVLGFAVHPCRNTSCRGASTSRIRLGTGERQITFNGNVRVARLAETGPDSRRACVYAQVRDLGPRGRSPGRIVRVGKRGLKGIRVCRTVGAADAG